MPGSEIYSDTYDVISVIDGVKFNVRIVYMIHIFIAVDWIDVPLGGFPNSTDTFNSAPFQKTQIAALWGILIN